MRWNAEIVVQSIFRTKRATSNTCGAQVVNAIVTVKSAAGVSTLQWQVVHHQWFAEVGVLQSRFHLGIGLVKPRHETQMD
jgi:glycine cleavage system pyridoxal-binding protein P